MSSPMGPVPPAPQPPPPVWNASNAAALCAELDRTREACDQAHAALRRDAVRATVEWRGSARVDFDTRLSGLLGALHDVEHLAGFVAAQVRAHDARIAQTRQALGIVECATPLAALCPLADLGR